MKKSKMRKILFAAAACVALLLIVTGCEGVTFASEKAVSVGKAAIRIADKYLDDKMTADEALDRLDILWEDLDDEEELSDADDRVKNLVLFLQIEIRGDSLRYDQYDDILETRNEIAEEIGAKKRK